jgi:hypothetical protein
MLSNREKLLAQKILIFIRKNKLNSYEISKQTNIAQRRLCLLLSGKRKINAIEYYRICFSLGVDLDEFYPNTKA